MGNIVLLDELTINKIAAGEVIERPASVIKEMVENSIDAGATNITVEIKNGGISYIRISDNGKGIAKDDVEMAFERHATSKIRSADDLQDIKSMGFRGEALASIAAIANVELVSKTEEQETGTKIIVEGGNVLGIEELGCSTGTIITVRNLFYNTPVRYKFLKKDFTETGYIEDVITRIALVHPEISIKLINSGKVVIQTNGSGDLQSVIYSIYGKDIATEVLPVSYEYEYIKVNGVIGKPAIARSNRSNQIFFVNKRYIKDKTLTSATEQAFKGIIPLGKFGFTILNLEMNPNKVDVNVHPAKLEVRFEDESVAFKAVYHAIKNTLLSADLISDREKNKEIKEASKDAFKIPVDGGLFRQTSEKEASTNSSIEIETNIKDKTEAETVDNAKINEKVEAIDTKTMDVFERLKNLQQSLKEQVAANPSIKLTDDYKKVEEKYYEIEKKAFAGKNEEEQDLNTTTDENVKSNIEEIDIKLNDSEMENDSVDVTQETSKISVTDILNKAAETEENQNNLNELNGPETILNGDIQETIKDEQKEKEESEQQTEKLLETTEREEDSEAGTTTEEGTKEVEEQEIPDADDETEKGIKTFEEMYRQLFGKEPYGGRKQEKKKEDPYRIKEEDLSDNISVFENIEEYKKPTYKFIGIAFKTYIILEMNQELYIMDQHAAHERILYEKVKANFFRDQDKECQMLLLPDVITLTPKEMGIAKDNFGLFRQAGFMVEEFGENTVKLSGVPPICVDLDTKELFMETLDEINTVARTAKQEKEEKFMATVACKAAVKANMALTEEEVNSLMDELLKLPNPFSCPHGRPTVIKMSKYDIERKFARK